MGGRRNYQTKKNRRRPRQGHSRLGRGSLRQRSTQRKRGGRGRIYDFYAKVRPSSLIGAIYDTIQITNDEAMNSEKLRNASANGNQVKLSFLGYNGSNPYFKEYGIFEGRVENGKLAYGEVKFGKPMDLHAPGKCIKYNGPFQQEGDKIGAPGGIIEFPEKVRDQYGDINLMLPDITCENHASYECILDGFEIIATKREQGFTGFENLTHFDPEKNEDATTFNINGNIVTLPSTNKDAIRDGSGYNVFVYIKEKNTIKFKLKNYKKVFERTCIPGIYTHGTFESPPAFGPVTYAKVFSENMTDLEAEAKAEAKAEEASAEKF